MNELQVYKAYNRALREEWFPEIYRLDQNRGN